MHGWFLPMRRAVRRAWGWREFRRGMLFLFTLAVFPGAVLAGEGAQTNAPPVSGPQLLAEVVSRLPGDPMRLTGELIVRKRKGVVLSRFQFELRLNLGESPSHALYTIRDAFGVELEQLAVTRGADGGTQFTYSSGSPLVEGPTPDLFATIQNSDVCWADLALSFLWWDGAQVAGSERVLDRDCYVVDVPAPADLSARAASGASRCAWVKVWIDKEMKMLFQAEGLDARRAPLSRLWVRSFKRFDGRWMIKDMEVQRSSGDQRTKLQIDDVATKPEEGVNP